jgi:lysophospholipase L1-like esterase
VCTKLGPEAFGAYHVRTDGLHPSDLGQSLILQQVAPELNALALRVQPAAQ